MCFFFNFLLWIFPQRPKTWNKNTYAEQDASQRNAGILVQLFKWYKLTNHFITNWLSMFSPVLHSTAQFFFIAIRWSSLRKAWYHRRGTWKRTYQTTIAHFQLVLDSFFFLIDAIQITFPIKAPVLLFRKHLHF